MATSPPTSGDPVALLKQVHSLGHVGPEVLLIRHYATRGAAKMGAAMSADAPFNLG